jgi:hypothetical protein
VQVVPSGQLSRAWFRGFAARHLPGVALPASGFSFREFLDANATRQLVYLVNKEPWQRTLEEAYTVWPLALADRVRKKSDAWDLKSWVEEADAGFRFDPKRADARGGSWERYVAANCRRQQQRFATSLVTAAAKRGGDPGAAKLLAHALEQVAARNPSPEPVLFKNLGVAYQVLWRAEPGDAAWRRGMRDAWTRYLALAPASDRDSAAIRELLRQEAAAR